MSDPDRKTLATLRRERGVLLEAYGNAIEPLNRERLKRQIDQIEVEIAGWSRLGSGSPEALLRKCDRAKHLAKLLLELGRHVKARPHRPFVCIIHGDDRERPDYFHEHLKRDVLPGLPGNRHGVNAFRINPPDRESLRKDPLQAFKNCVVDGEDGFTRRLDELIGIVANNPAPVLLNLRLFRREADAAANKVIDAFLAFWDGHWPDLPEGQRLVVCFSLTYETAGSLRLRRWPRMFAINRSRRMAALNRNSKREIEQLARSLDGEDGNECYQQLSVAVIPELGPVSREDALRWAEDCDLPKEDIVRLFGSRDSVPLNDITDHFMKKRRRK